MYLHIDGSIRYYNSSNINSNICVSTYSWEYKMKCKEYWSPKLNNNISTNCTDDMNCLLTTNSKICAILMVSIRLNVRVKINLIQSEDLYRRCSELN